LATRQSRADGKAVYSRRSALTHPPLHEGAESYHIESTHLKLSVDVVSGELTFGIKTWTNIQSGSSLALSR